jgi:hypothetical protein
MLETILTDANGQRWRVKAKSERDALNEIAHARVTGSVGSSTTIDETRCGGTLELLADVHKIDADGNDVQPS